MAKPKMAEKDLAALGNAHEWVSIDDPDENRTWLVDVTFLESGWRCIYLNGCQGVLTGPAPELQQGCCSYGAHLTGDEDAERVGAAALTLTAEQWQFRQKGRSKRGVIYTNSDGELVTRLVDEACIFLNRPGFEGGAGCALHRAALERGVEPLEAQARRLLAAAAAPLGRSRRRRARDVDPRRVAPPPLG